MAAKLVPGAPLLEQAISQKQFIIKKSSKSKPRGKSKPVAAGSTGGMMKAYFPNLIAKKDVTMISPMAMNAAQFSTQPMQQPQIQNQNAHIIA